MSSASPKLAFVAAEFNHALIDVMMTAAADEAKTAGAEVVSTTRVPGCYEVPLVVSRTISQDVVDAVVVLGYIERGETQHGAVMGQVVHDALMRLSLEHDKPIGLGIVGPGATPEQAELRKDGYARAAVRAALAALKATPRAKR
jgi:6,7-dimethyl-8-ribityllumazine synthase